MMVVKKYGEAISQERIVGNGCLKKSFLHVSRKVRPKSERCVAQQQLKFPGQVIHMPPLGFDLVVRLEKISGASDMSADQPIALLLLRLVNPNRLVHRIEMSFDRC